MGSARERPKRPICTARACGGGVYRRKKREKVSLVPSGERFFAEVFQVFQVFQNGEREDCLCRAASPCTHGVEI